VISLDFVTKHIKDSKGTKQPTNYIYTLMLPTVNPENSPAIIKNGADIIGPMERISIVLNSAEVNGHRLGDWPVCQTSGEKNEIMWAVLTLFDSMRILLPWKVNTKGQ